MKKITPVGPGGNLHIAALLAAAAATRPMHGRGLGRIVEKTARVFREDRQVWAKVHSNRVMEVSIRDGYWMPVLLGRPYEPEVGEILEASLNPSSLFLDLGANLGYWSLYASTIIRDPSRVIAVEASPQTAALLERNAEINAGCFTSISAAIWSTPNDEIEIASDPTRHAWTSASGQIVERLGAMGFQRMKIQTTTIDELCNAFDGDDVVIKIDLEGAEIDGLKGGIRTLEEHDCVVVFERHEREFGNNAKEFLESAGYVVRGLNSQASSRSTGRNYLATRSRSRHSP